jgi:hypothetical protein
MGVRIGLHRQGLRLRTPYKTDALGHVKDAKSFWRFGKTAKKHPNTKSFRKSLADVADVAY